ncbi:MAG: carboxypeptidase-like regulatory domain-containing protein [Planctomycetota bacterium]
MDSASSPAVGAHVVIWNEQESRLLSDTTGSDGVAGFSGSDGAGVIVAVAPWGALTDARAPRLTGSHVLALGGASVMQGVVLVDGLPAAAGLELKLLTQPGPALAGAAEPLLKWVREIVSEVAFATTRTEVEGRFRFTGLAADWHGVLLPPRTHWITAGQGEPWIPQCIKLSLPPADPNMTLRLTRLPTVSGRVVWDDDGTPVASAAVLVLGGYSGGVSGPVDVSASVVSDEQGRFEVGLTPNIMIPDVWQDPGKRGTLDRVSVFGRRVAGAADDAQVDSIVKDGVAEPVELRVRRAARVHFAAIGLEAEPIPLARVDVGAVTPTDRNGRGSFSGPMPSLVGAPGCAVVPAVAQRGTGASEDPFVFLLPPRNSLRIQVESSMPLLGRKLRVVLESDSPMMAGGRLWRPFDAEFGGALEAALDATGVLDIHSLEPHTDCVAKVKDYLGFVIAEQRVRAPAYGKHVVTILRVEAAPRRIAGIVRGEDGRALDQARVRLDIAKLDQAIYTQKDGAFEFVVHSAAPADIRVSASGYVSEWRRGLVPSDHANPIDFRMRKGRSLLIRVRDPGGAAVPLLAQPLGFEHLEVQRMGDGDWLWHDLPPLVEFYADLQGHRFVGQCDASVSTATLPVPGLARVSAPTSALPSEVGRDPHACRVLLRCSDGQGHGDVLLEFSAGEPAWQVLFPGRYEARIVARSENAGSGAGSDFVSLGIRKELFLTAGADKQLDFK